MLKPESIAKFESFELPSNQARKCGTHHGVRLWIFGHASREKVNIIDAFVEILESKPNGVWYELVQLFPFGHIVIKTRS